VGLRDPQALANPQVLGDFVVRQFFMRNPAEERAQLHLVEEALLRCTSIVSFNGRGFDMPLINNRFVLSAMPPPLAGAPHLDLLPPARRLWKARWGSCSLGNLERNVLGFQRTAEDVPGYLIPDIYRQYYLTGVATEMLAHVFYHNLEDIVSMVMLGARMARFFRQEQQERSEGLAEHLAGLHPLEYCSLGRCYDALDWTEASITVYRAALDRAPGDPLVAQILRELGYLYKRLERRDEAVGVWEDWIGTVSGDDLTPYIELAKHHEWHTLDLAAARGWAAWALRIAEGWPPGIARTEALADLRHRLERVARKLAGNILADDPTEIDAESGTLQTD
jgi:tetratricopeptide (TPR) repeat protein